MCARVCVAPQFNRQLLFKHRLQLRFKTFDVFLAHVVRHARRVCTTAAPPAAMDPFTTIVLPCILSYAALVLPAHPDFTSRWLPQLVALSRVWQPRGVSQQPTLVDEASGSSTTTTTARQVTASAVAVDGDTAASSSYYYAVLESEHPYAPASTQVWHVRFPADVAWATVEFDPRSCTVHERDKVVVEPVELAACGKEGWPSNPIVVPLSTRSVVSGEVSRDDRSHVLRVRFSTTSAPPGVAAADIEKRNWGFRAVVTGTGAALTPKVDLALLTHLWLLLLCFAVLACLQVMSSQQRWRLHSAVCACSWSTWWPLALRGS